MAGHLCLNIRCVSPAWALLSLAILGETHANPPYVLFLMTTPFALMMAKHSHLLLKVAAHPFPQQVYKGTLPKHAFRLYIEQDVLYLRDFSNALSLVSNRFSDKAYALQFKTLSNYISESELKLHLNYLAKPNLHSFFSAHHAPLKTPITKMYTKHLIQHATLNTVPIEAAVASLVPCWEVYMYLGTHMGLSLPMEQPYRSIISSYSSERFRSSTVSIIHTAKALTAAVTCPKTLLQIEHAYVRSLQFELLFFDAIYSQNNSHTQQRHIQDPLILKT